MGDGTKVGIEEGGVKGREDVIHHPRADSGAEMTDTGVDAGAQEACSLVWGMDPSVAGSMRYGAEEEGVKHRDNAQGGLDRVGNK